MLRNHNRVNRERHTIGVMIRLYCRKHHLTTKGLCESCEAINKYAEERLSNCSFKSDKPTCFNCSIHCYKKEMREKIKEIMQYSGPRMIWHHPLLAILHVYDGIRRKKS